MKRWGFFASAVAVIVVGWLLLTRARGTEQPPAKEPQRPPETQSSSQVALLPSARRQDTPRTPAIAPPTQSGDGNPWQKQALERHDLLLNLKPERAGEIEAVAPRLHLAPNVVQKLIRWSDLLADLSASKYSSVSDHPDLERAHEFEGKLGEAHHRAEIRLLGGLDQWNRYYRLKGASMTGHLEDVDDTGDWKGRDPNEKPIGWGTRHFAPPRIDTSEVDHYFAE
jgi:hypothetical protein